VRQIPPRFHHVRVLVRDVKLPVHHVRVLVRDVMAPVHDVKLPVHDVMAPVRVISESSLEEPDLTLSAGLRLSVLRLRTFVGRGVVSLRWY